MMRPAQSLDANDIARRTRAREERRVTAREVYQTLGGEKRNDHEYLCRCPCGLHKRGDIHPSLSVKDGRNGRPLLHCFVGGDYRDVVTALRARGLRL
jgi:hypothetical protein